MTSPDNTRTSDTEGDPRNPQPETTTYLEMIDPSSLRPARAARAALDVRRIDPSDFNLGRSLYMEVGTDWLWIDRLVWTDAQWRDYYGLPWIELWVGYAGDDAVGYFELSSDGGGSTELAYFGLRPAFIGQGFGGALLTAAIERAWRTGARRVWVHTSSRDHEHALANYLARGFRVYRTETKPVPTQARTA